MGSQWVTLAALIVIVLLPRVGFPQFEGSNIVPSQINNSVYEVIVPKPLEDPLTYEKPLPIDLLPFKIRNDKYYSIGTAFALSDTEFVTAAHVMALGGRTQFKGMFLRDVNDHVFAIDQIIKVSSRCDFVVFTVKDRSSKEHLARPRYCHQGWPEYVEYPRRAGWKMELDSVLRRGLAGKQWRPSPGS